MVRSLPRGAGCCPRAVEATALQRAWASNSPELEKRAKGVCCDEVLPRVGHVLEREVSQLCKKPFALPQ